MTRDRLVSFFFIALLLFILYQVCLIFSVFFEPIFWAGVLAFLFYPIFKKLKTMLGGLETPSALLTLLLILLTVVPLIAVLVVHLAAEVIKLYDFLLSSLEDGRFKQWVDQVRHFAIIKKLESHAMLADFIRSNSQAWIVNTAKTLGNFTAKQLAFLTRNVALFALNLLLTLFLSFFFLKDGQKIFRFIYEITPLDEKDKKHLFKRINETFAAVLQGQLLTAIAQALTAGIIFWSLALPLPIFAAALTFLAAFLPVMGASLVWGFFVIYLIFLQQYTKALILFFLGTCVISLVDNLLKPLFIGGKTKLPYLVLFLGILGGLSLYGFVGIFLAPTLLSLFFALIELYKEKFLS